MNELNKIKPFFDEKRQILGNILPLDTPFKVLIASSENCNFRCNYCFRSDENKENWGYTQGMGLMSWDIFEKTVEQIKKFPQEVKQISLSCHGEPLCNRKLPEMVRYIKKENIKSTISIHTNASLLDEQYALELAESEIDKIIVSMQGMTAEKYYEVCGARIDFDKFYENLGILYHNKKNTQVFIKTVDAALEDGEEAQFYDQFEMVADRVYIEKTVPIWKRAEQQVPIMEKNKYGMHIKEQKCCSAVFRMLVVEPNGDIYPCTQILRNQKLGNIQKDTLVECWNGKKRRRLLENILTLEPDAMCEGCNIRQNSVFASEDMIDDYREEILERLKKSEG